MFSLIVIIITAVIAFILLGCLGWVIKAFRVIFNFLLEGVFSAIPFIIIVVLIIIAIIVNW